MTDEDRYLYQRLADDIAALIGGGTFEIGARLPSLRTVSRRENLSLATVMKAFQMLEERGLLEARPQSGFYVKRRPGDLHPSPRQSTPGKRALTVDVASLVQEVIAASGRREVVPLGAALPSPALLPVTRLSRALARGVRRDPVRATCDGRPEGQVALRQAIARRALEAGCRFAADDLIVTNGCTEALNLALQAVTRPGDTVAVESPAYFCALQVIESLHLRVLELPTDPQTGLDVDAALEVARRGIVRAFLLTPTFHNPLGSVMPDTARERLVNALNGHDLPIIEDDIYGEFHPDNRPRPRALKAFDRNGRVLYCSSFSKSLAPGLRVGWIAPGRHYASVLRLKSAVSLASSGPAQAAVSEYLSGGGFDLHLRRLRRTFAINLDRMRAAVARHFPADTLMTQPIGSFVLWVQVPGLDATKLYRQALTANISIAPGCIFTATGGYGDCFRLNAGHPWGETMERAIATLGALAQELRPAGSPDVSTPASSGRPA